MKDYIIIMEQRKYYQILKSFANDEEADEYARTVEFDEEEIESDTEYRWAELSGA